MTFDNNQGLIYNSQAGNQPGFSQAVNATNPFNNSSLNFTQGQDNKRISTESRSIGEIVPGRVADRKSVV